MEQWRLFHYQDGDSVTSLTLGSEKLYISLAVKESEVCQTGDGANPGPCRKQKTLT